MTDLAVVELGIVELVRAALRQLLEVIWVLHIREVVVLPRLVARRILTLERFPRLLGVRGIRVVLALVTARSMIGVSRLVDHLLPLVVTLNSLVVGVLDVGGPLNNIVIFIVDGIVQDLFFGLDLISWIDSVISLAFGIFFALVAESTIIIIEQGVGPLVIVEHLVRLTSLARS